VVQTHFIRALSRDTLKDLQKYTGTLMEHTHFLWRVPKISGRNMFTGSGMSSLIRNSSISVEILYVKYDIAEF
jgi:hypothetical protein